MIVMVILEDDGLGKHPQPREAEGREELYVACMQARKSGSSRLVRESQLPVLEGWGDVFF